MAHTGDLLAEVGHEAGVVLVDRVVGQVQELLVQVVPAYESNLCGGW